MELKEDLLEKAISESIAAEILTKIKDVDKEKLLIKGIANSIDGYDFRRKMQSCITKIAMQNVMEYMEHDEVRGRIRREAHAAVEKFIGVLEKAMLSCMLEMLGHNASQYNKPEVYTQIKKLLNME